MALRSSLLVGMLERVTQVGAEDPFWDEVEEFVRELQDRAARVTQERQRLRRVRRVCAQWALEDQAMRDALGHRVCAAEAVPVMQVDAFEQHAHELFASYATLRELTRATPKDLATAFTRAQKIAATVEKAGAAYQKLQAVLDPAPPPVQPVEPSTDGSATPPTGQTGMAPGAAPGESATASHALPVEGATAPQSKGSVPRKPPLPSAAQLVALGRTGTSATQDVMMCLDFGTARSKAMAMRGRGGPVFLKIGKAAKARYENSIASSVWIDPKNRVVLFGDKAIEASLVQGDRQQERIDSLKDFLSSPIGDQLPDPRGRLLPEGMDIQRSGFTVGAILVLYLGYLSWAAEASAQEAGLAGEVSRRFTIPSWPTSHRAAGIGLLREYLARATLAGRFVGSRFLDGLPVEEAKALASAAFEVPTDALPSDLFKEGITEPLAAIGTRTEELTRRNGLVMIVDIGAGTTDFGLFLVSSPKSEPRFIEVASHSINCAGNHLDTHLHEYIFGRMGIGGMAAAAAKLELLLRQREIKEELFGQGRASVSLPAGYSVQLRCNEFLSQDVVRQFQHQLEQALQYTLQQVEDNATRKSVSIDWDRYSQVRVVRTGGGADLPMVKALAPGTWRPRRNPAVSLGDASVQLQSSPLLPDSVQRTGLDAAAYLPLAVAWGGAMPELPTQGKPVELATLSQYDPRKVADAVAVNSEHWSEKKS